MYCIDASVLTNSFVRGEKFHEQSRRVMERIRKEKSIVYLPEIVLPEVASALARGTGNHKTPLEFVAEIRRVPNFVFIPIDSELSNLASKFAAENKMKGCDSIYAAVSFRFDCKLVTLDNEQKERASKIIKVVTPDEELDYR